MNLDLATEVRRLVRRHLEAQPSRRKTASVTGTSPLTVRFVGDSADTTVPLIRAGYSPSSGDTVVLERVGPSDDAPSSWVAVYSIVEA